jgi:hypothetical protein
MAVANADDELARLFPDNTAGALVGALASGCLEAADCRCDGCSLTSVQFKPPRQKSEHTVSRPPNNDSLNSLPLNSAFDSGQSGSVKLRPMEQDHSYPHSRRIVAATHLVRNEILMGSQSVSPGLTRPATDLADQHFAGTI